MSTADLTALCDQGREHFRKARYVEASQAYLQALDLDPDSKTAVEGLALTYFAHGDFASAVEQFQRLTLLDPTVGRHFINWGAALNRMGKHTAAIDVLRKAIQRERRSPDAYFNLAIAERKGGQVTQAVQAYKQAILLNPKLAEAYLHLGVLYLDQNNHTLATQNFKKALEVKPGWDKAQAGLERAEAAMKQVKASANPFGRLVQAAAQPAKAVTTSARQLDDTERAVDRRKVSQMAEELRRLGNDCLTFLHQRFEPALLALQRTVAEGDLTGLAFGRAATDFTEAREQWIALRRQLKRKSLELRAHEEMMNTPELADLQ